MLATVEEYIMSCEPLYQERLLEIQQKVQEIYPAATQRMSWGLPTFDYYGSLFQFGACKGYIGFYVGPVGVQAFQEQLQDYKTTKAAIHLPMKKALPWELMLHILAFCAKQNEADAEAKKAKKAKK